MGDETVDVGPVTVGPTMPRQKTEPPVEVLLGVIEHALGHAGYSPDAYLAFAKLCDRLGIREQSLKYERGWAKKYLT